MEYRTKYLRFQISKSLKILRFHKISGSLYEISSELRTPLFACITPLYLWLHIGCRDFSNKIFGHGAMTLGTALTE